MSTNDQKRMNIQNKYLKYHPGRHRVRANELKWRDSVFAFTKLRFSYSGFTDKYFRYQRVTYPNNNFTKLV